jgi:hypothetical protein
MAPPEKRNPPANLIDTSIPTDSPPSYEHTILPTTNPWTTTESQSTQDHQHPHQQPQPQTPAQQSLPQQQQCQNPTPSIPSQNPLSALSRLSTVPFSKYRVRDSTLSEDLNTVTTTSPDLTGAQPGLDWKTQARNVLKFVNEQASLPPKPIMLVRGTHAGNGAQIGVAVVDFELRFNLSCLLGLEEDEGQARVVVKAYQAPAGPGAGSSKLVPREERGMSGLELWVKRFCEDKAENRR